MRRWASFLLLGVIVQLQAQDVELQNQHTSPTDEVAGARLFRQKCAACHGLKGTGDFGADLTREQFRYGSSDAALYRTIRGGISASEMPGMGLLPEKHIWQMVTYVRSLSRRSPVERLSGDPANGEKLFFEKGQCARCHIVNGRGGRLGNELSDIGWMRSPQHLRVSILNPNEAVSRRYWSFQVTDREGRIIEGIRVNEDTYSIQILDLEENFHSLWKRDLPEIRVQKTSWMPSYEDSFTRNELDDLVAYLYSLRRKEKSQ